MEKKKVKTKPYQIIHFPVELIEKINKKAHELGKQRHRYVIDLLTAILNEEIKPDEM